MSKTMKGLIFMTKIVHVPSEPTEDMEVAGKNAFENATQQKISFSLCRTLYKAMLQAAPRVEGDAVIDWILKRIKENKAFAERKVEEHPRIAAQTLLGLCDLIEQYLQTQPQTDNSAALAFFETKCLPYADANSGDEVHIETIRTALSNTHAIEKLEGLPIREIVEKYEELMERYRGGVDYYPNNHAAQVCSLELALDQAIQTLKEQG